MSKFELNELFCDGMVLQRDIPVHIYGRVSKPGRIHVNFDGIGTGKDVEPGPFCIELPPHKAGKDLTMTVSFGQEAVTVQNIDCGEVWVAGGQSNMAMSLKDTEGFKAGEKVISNNDIRLYTVGRNIFARPEEYPSGYEWAFNEDCRWDGCSEKNAPYFSAVGYYFAQDLYEKLKVPVGIINCNVGGSSIFNWMPREVIEANPAIARVYTDYMQKLSEVNRDEAKMKYTAYLDSVQKEWTSKEYLVSTGGECPVVYYEEFGPYSFKQPCNLWHSMYEKISRYSVRGMIWYQGESESFSESSYLYESAMNSLLDNFKKVLGQENYAFHYVQIPPFNCDTIRDWEGICNAQREFHLHHPECGMITTGDCSGGEDIHPPIKRPLGNRLSKAACALTYGMPCEYTGPIAKAAHYENGKIIVEFSHADGLYLDDSVDSLEVEYEDGSVTKEKSAIVNNTLVVNCSNGSPTAIRCGWRTFYQIGIFNSENIPAGVFRICFK